MYKVFIENRPLIISKPENVLDSPHVIYSTNVAEIRQELPFILENGTQITTENPEVFMNAIFEDHLKIRASGGAVIKDSQLLMIKRLGYWDLPKGKLEEKEEPQAGAMREVMEECGVENLNIISSLPDTFHTYQFGAQKFLKQTHWFLMSAEGNQELKPQLEEDITEVIWVPMEEVMKLAAESYPSLNEIFESVVHQFKIWNTI